MPATEQLKAECDSGLIYLRRLGGIILRAVIRFG